MARKFREMPVEVLRYILDGLPDGCTIQANTAGQLIISSTEDEVIGYIDFERGEYVATKE